MYIVGTAEKTVSGGLEARLLPPAEDTRSREDREFEERNPSLHLSQVHGASNPPDLNSTQAPAIRNGRMLIARPVTWCTGSRCNPRSWGLIA